MTTAWPLSEILLQETMSHVNGVSKEYHTQSPSRVHVHTDSTYVLEQCVYVLCSIFLSLYIMDMYIQLCEYVLYVYIPPQLLGWLWRVCGAVSVSWRSC